MDQDPIQGEVEIIQAASREGNQDKLQQDGIVWPDRLQFSVAQIAKVSFVGGLATNTTIKQNSHVIYSAKATHTQLCMGSSDKCGKGHANDVP